jgi:hypothetical protein
MTFLLLRVQLMARHMLVRVAGWSKIGMATSQG